MMQKPIGFRDAVHHPYISTYFCGKQFYSPCFCFMECKLHDMQTQAPRTKYIRSYKLMSKYGSFYGIPSLAS